MQHESNHKVTCINCGNVFGLAEAFRDELGWHTTCPKCKRSFDMDLPNDSELLRYLLGYIRTIRIAHTESGCYTIYFRCDPDMSSPTIFSQADCQACPKAGCHKFAALNDAEKILCGE